MFSCRPISLTHDNILLQELLKELVDAGKIKARTKWKDVYPLFSKDERYINMLGNPGSNPLELFWDIVDSYDQQLDIKVALAEDAIREYNHKNYPNGSSLHDEDDKEKYKDKDGDYDMDGDKEKEKKPAEAGFVFGPDTAQKEFIEIVRESEDKEVQRLTSQDLKDIFEYVSLLLQYCRYKILNFQNPFNLSTI